MNSYKQRLGTEVAQREQIGLDCKLVQAFSESGARTIRTLRIRKRKKGFRVLTEPTGEYKEVLRTLLRILKYSFKEYLSAHPPHRGLHQLPDQVCTWTQRVRRKDITYIKMDLKKAFHHVSPAAVVQKIVRHTRGESAKFLLDHLDLMFHPTKELLPQGYPTSPFLFNLCAHNIDFRIYQLLRSGITARVRRSDPTPFYYRYIDDLLIVCATNKALIKYLEVEVEKCVRVAGFRINRSKTQARTPSMGQQAHVLGYVADNMCENLRTSKRLRNRQRMYQHIWDKFPSRRTEELKQKLNGFAGIIKGTKHETSIKK